MKLTRTKISLTTLIIILLPVTSILSAQGYFYNEYKSRAYYTEGTSYYNNGKSNKALACFQASLVYEPDYYMSLMMAGISCRNLDLYASAIYYFGEAIDSSGGSAQAYGNLGALYAELGYDKLAFESLYEAIDRKSGYAHPYNNIGGILLRYGKYDEAITYLRKAIKYDKKMPDSYFNIGTAYYETDRKDSALFYYSKAIEVNPQFIKAYLAKATVLQSMDRPKEEYEALCNKAIEAYSKTIGQNQGYDAFRMRANAYKLLGQDVDMKKDLEHKLVKLNEFIDLYPEAYPLIRDRAETYLEMGNKQAAIADYNRVLEINPEYQRVEKKLKKILEEK